MKKRFLKKLALLMSFITTLGTLPVNAYELDAQGYSIESIEYQSSSDDDFSNVTNIFAEIGSEYTVTIPKVIVLSGETKSAKYNVSVEGDIAGYETIYVVPDEIVDLYSVNKEMQLGAITQDRTKWTYSVINEVANGLIKADLITAGRWTGTFNFNISLDKVLGDVMDPDHVHIPMEPVMENVDRATCTEGGSYDEVTYCSICKLEVSRTPKIVGALGHTPALEGEKENIIESTCLDEGSYDDVIYCSVCGEELSRSEITTEPLGHEFVDGYCIRCNAPEHIHTELEPVMENMEQIPDTTTWKYDEVVYCETCGEEISRIEKTFEKTVTDFAYTGKTQLFTAPANGTYLLEVWGAGGGGGTSGGYGAYLAGEVTLKAGDNLYVNVGGTTGGGGGGWNGGGTNREKPYGGGGATDIALNGTDQTTSWNTTDHLYSRILVAGGGGGYNAEGGNRGGNAGFPNGGSGGGQAGGGGTLSRGGTTETACATNPVNGSFGVGGTTNWANEYLGAGGGGWYGGGAGGGQGDNGSGGGGSSYVWSNDYASYYPNSTYKPSTDYYITNFKYTNGTNTGNGKAKITFLQP